MSRKKPPTICHIIPPHMHEEMMKASTKRTRDIGLSNRLATERAMAAREIMATMRPRTAAAAFGPAANTKKERVVRDAKKKPSFDGKIVRREGDPNTGDKEVDEAYRYTGSVYDFYKKFFQRNSIDDMGLALNSNVRYREDPSMPYNNAFWFNNQMAYGEGDGVVFKRFTIALDVIGHELTHGVVEYSAGLVYRNESGALNESYADVFGSLIKQWRKGQTADKADWLIGDDLIVPAPTRQAIRSMANPGQAYADDPILGDDPQPGHVRDQYRGFADNGGVHINSGIPNHAFYNVALEIGGNAWEDAGTIWYDALQRLPPNCTFQQCATQTSMSAGMLFGNNSAQQKAVKKGWKAVGVSV